jgi:hypothetical protein
MAAPSGRGRGGDLAHDPEPAGRAGRRRNACAERSARCRFCQVLLIADGLATLDCDLFDNDTADLSCQQTP